MRRSRQRIGDIVTPIIEAAPDGGSSAEDAVLFVHGNPGSSEEFADLLQRIGAHRRAFAIDMPGFGRADKPDGFDPSAEGYARHLADVADTLGVRRVHLVLHDLGGSWGLRFAYDHPDRVASVALMNATGMPAYRWHLLAHLWRRPGLGEVMMRALNRSTFGLALRAGNPVPIPEHHVETMYANLDAATRRAILRIYRSIDVQELDRVADSGVHREHPALVIWGETDPYISLTDAQRFRRMFRDVRFVRIADHGHWPHLTAPGEVATALEAWLLRDVAP